MKMASETKRGIWKIAILVLAIILYIYCIHKPSFVNIPKNQIVDLSRFSGTIYQDKELTPIHSVFTATVPFTEAMTWGKNATLSYGNEGIKMWKPDPIVSGKFQVAQIEQPNVFLRYETQKNPKFIILKLATNLQSFAFFTTMLIILMIAAMALVDLKYDHSL
jgi:hypothetical protein